MPKYEVETKWNKRSNGTSTYLIEADSAEEAGKNYRKGDRIEHRTKQDYTENEIQSITNHEGE